MISGVVNLKICHSTIWLLYHHKQQQMAHEYASKSFQRNSVIHRKGTETNPPTSQLYFNASR